MTTEINPYIDEGVLLFNDKMAPVQADQYHREFTELLDLYEDFRPRHVLEIGSFMGGSLYQWMVHSQDKARIVAIDLPGGVGGRPQYIQQDRWKAWAQVLGVDFHLLMGDSEDPRIVDKAEELGPYDWIFVDGDHSYGHVIADYMHYWRLLSEPGIMIFHDIADNPDVGASQFWDEMEERYERGEGERLTTMISSPGQKWRGLGLIWKE